MELIKFNPGTYATELENAEVITGYDSLQWVERYRRAGEFKLVAPMSSGVLQQLPLNTFVSLEESYDVMLVENHVLKEERGKDPTVEISGRSFDAWLENRIVGLNLTQTSTPPVNDIELAAADTWDQVVTLINTHIQQGVATRPWDVLQGMAAIADNPGTLTGKTPTNERRVLERGPVSARVVEILAVDDLGLRMVRRNPFGDLGDPNTTWFLVHAGVDRSDQVIFSWNVGDLDSADYLWSTKTEKNSALVTSRYLEAMVFFPNEQYFGRKGMYINASDVDQSYTTEPTDPQDIADIVQALETRGKEQLTAQRPYILTRADIAPEARFAYRSDYDIGDIVSVDGSYGDIVPMRVTEFTQILDEGGESGHPTLEALYE